MAPSSTLIARAFEWTDLVPEKGHGLHGEIKCYSLPYGLLGFISHLLTYYTIACFWAGRSPLWPFHRLTYGRIGFWLSIVSLVLTLAVSTFTIVRCQNTWQLLLIAVWKLAMSLMNSAVAIHVTKICKEHEDGGGTPGGDMGGKLRPTMWWTVLYLPGMFAGMVGLMSLVVQNFHIEALKILTVVFYTIVGFGIMVGLLSIVIGRMRKPRYESIDRKETVQQGLGGLIISVMIYTVLAAFYGDWALGLMTDNLIGLPSGDYRALYWLYFTAKRLPMFSM